MKLPSFAALAAVALAVLTAGCETHPSLVDSARTGPFYKPSNYTGLAHLPYSIRRVVILPVHAEEAIPTATVEELDNIFTTALQHQHRFEVVALTRDECAKTFGVPDLSSASALPHDFLSILASKFEAQGVMFVDITSFDAYPPLGMGIRAKLAATATQGLLWSFDDSYSLTNPPVVNSLRKFYLHSDRGDVPVDLSTDALESPSRFAAFAADNAFRTLPPP